MKIWKKVYLVLIILAVVGLAVWASQRPSKVVNVFAATCAPGECGSKYECENHTMCCTGGGCPSYMCSKKGDSWYWKKSASKCCKDYPTGTQCYKPNGTCSRCSGTGGDGDGDGDGGGCSWGGNVTPGACVQAQGIYGSYYRDNPVGDPYYDGGLKKWTKNDRIGFDEINIGNCNDNFGVIWGPRDATNPNDTAGWLHIPSTGNWRFATESDDGMRIELRIGGSWQTVASDWSSHGTRVSWGSWMAFNAGYYQIRVWFFQGGGGNTAKVKWQGPGVNQQTIPSTYYLTCYPPLQGPTNPTATNITDTSARLNWIRGSGGVKQLLRVGTDSAKVQAGCPDGVGPGTGCAIKDDNVVPTCAPSSPCTYPTGNVLESGQSYFWRVVEYLNSSTFADFGFLPTFTTTTRPWVKADNGDIHSNSSISFSRNPASPVLPYNGQFMISAASSITNAKSQPGWLLSSYPASGGSGISISSYSELFNLYGKTLSGQGPFLPNPSTAGTGVYLVTGSATISSGGYNISAANRDLLIFVNGNLTIDGNVQVNANSTLTFIVGGNISIRGSVTSVQANLLAGGTLGTAYAITPQPQLVVEGSLITLKSSTANRIFLNRTLMDPQNLGTPAELVQPRVGIFVRSGARRILGKPQIFWREIPAN